MGGYSIYDCLTMLKEMCSMKTKIILIYGGVYENN